MYPGVATKLALAAGLSCALAFPISAQQPGEELQGVITHVELRGSPRVIKVNVPGKGEVTAGIANRTRIVAKYGVAGLSANPELSDLQPGMTVRFKFDPQTVERIHIVDAPPGMRPRSEDKTPTGGQAQELKVRILSTNGRDQIDADVAGRRQTYRVSDSGLLRGFRNGDLVVLTLDSAGLVSDIRSAAQSGRVVSVRQREVVIEVDGREESFGVDDGDALRGIRPGQTVRFDAEERAGGRRVITRVY
jgi:hypothetical protein